MQPILIRGARQLLTLQGPQIPRRGAHLNELNIILDGSVLIRDGLIDEIGPTRRVENLEKARCALEIDAAGRVVMPGFVDGHTHMMFPPPGRGEMSQESAVRTLVSSTAQRLAIRGRRYLESMARHGTTTIESSTGCGPLESAEAKILRVLGVLQGRPVDIVPTLLFRLPPERNAEVDEAALEWAVREFMPKVRRRRLARVSGVVWDPHPARAALLSRYLQAARALGFTCKLHAEEPFPPEILAQSVVSVDHAGGMVGEGLRHLASSPAVVTMTPGTCLRTGEYPPARELIDSGAAVALGTNFNSRMAPAFSMQAAISLACLAMRMSPAEAITAATVNAAHANGTAAEAGVLAVGKPADVLLLNASDYRELGTQFGANMVHMTIKRGCTVYREGPVTKTA